MKTVYTARIGGGLPLPKRLETWDHSWDYICFTDEKEKLPQPWQSRPTKLACLTPRLTARFHKANPNAVLDGYDTTIWIDLCFALEEPEKVIKDLGDDEVLTFRHPDRSSVREEAKVIRSLKKASNLQVDAILMVLELAGYDDDIPLPATGLIARRDTIKVIEFNETWWKLIRLFCVRDQMSFGLAAHNASVSVRFLEGNYRNHPLVWRD